MNANEKQVWFNEAQSSEYFFYRQSWHFLALLILIPITWSFAAPVMGHQSWLGMTDITWFWSAVGLSILQQILAWIIFRSQLGWATLSRQFGRFDLYVWGLLFLPLLVARPIFILGLAYSTRDSLMLHRTIAIVLALVLMIPAIYTLWSTFKYFTIARAIGGDHFRIPYRHMPLVTEGAFKYSRNAMYSFAFFLLWSIALLIGSQAALSVALFEHAYIWVHYFCTEKPDMEIIYRNED